MTRKTMPNYTTSEISSAVESHYFRAARKEALGAMLSKAPIDWDRSTHALVISYRGVLESFMRDVEKVPQEELDKYDSDPQKYVLAMFEYSLLQYCLLTFSNWSKVVTAFKWYKTKIISEYVSEKPSNRNQVIRMLEDIASGMTP